MLRKTRVRTITNKPQKLTALYHKISLIPPDRLSPEGATSSRCNKQPTIANYTQIAKYEHAILGIHKK